MENCINIKKGDELYYHIYFNNNKEEEIKRCELEENYIVDKINILIDYKLSFWGLFLSCKCIESIYFKRFYRNNVTNMRGMFLECSSLKEINLSNFNTNNVTNMSRMFYGCSDEIKMKVKEQIKNIKEEAFNN